MLKFTVPPLVADINLKTFLAQQNISATAYKKLKYAGHCRVNEQITHSNALLHGGDVVELLLPEESTSTQPVQGPLDIIYEDDYLLVLNKPAGLLTHPTVKEPEASLANYVAGYYEKTSQHCGIHPLSRLDKETSGLVVFGKNSLVHHLVTSTPTTKEYWGLVQGTPSEKSGTITAPIARKPGSIIERQVDFATGQSASTTYEVLETFPQVSLLHFILHTGRTHQIRIHCSFLGCPLLGDNLYGTPGPQGRHLLHAGKLTLQMPFTKENRTFTAPLPEDMERVLREERKLQNIHSGK